MGSGKHSSMCYVAASRKGRAGGWGGRIRTFGPGSKAPRLTTWPRPNCDASGGPARTLRSAPRRAARPLRPRPRHQAGRWRPDLLPVHGQDLVLEVLPHLVVQRVGDVLESAVLPLLARHRHEKPLRTMDDLDVRHDETLVEDDGNERLELLVVDRDDLDVRDLHGDRSSPMPERAYPNGALPDAHARRYCSTLKVRVRNALDAGFEARRPRRAHGRDRRRSRNRTTRSRKVRPKALPHGPGGP